jgi:hypothetical protein
MTDEPSALVGRFWSMLQQSGCRAVLLPVQGKLQLACTHYP